MTERNPHADLDSISGQLDEAATIERVVNRDRTGRLDSISGRLDTAAETERVVHVDQTGRLDAIETAQKVVAGRMETFEGLLAENTAQTRANSDMTRDVHEMLLAWRAGMNALAKFGRGLAWVGIWVLKILKVGGAIAAAVYAIWLLIYAYTHGGPKQ